MNVNEATSHFTKRPVWAQIDLTAAAENMQRIRKHVGNTVSVCAVVKGNAYGHGAVEMAGVFLDNGADRLAVACLDEAIELRQHGITASLLVLGHTDGRRASDIIQYDIETTVFCYEDAKHLSEAAEKAGTSVKIHFAADTGMGRIGYQVCEESIREIKKISRLPFVAAEGFFTHFCVSDIKDKTFTQEQFRRFSWFRRRLEEEHIPARHFHCCGRAGVLAYPEFYCDMVRPGIIQYGCDPSSEVTTEGYGLQSVMSLRCCITHVKMIEKGSTVSYGRRFTAPKPTKIATLPVGYADGYPRRLSNQTEILVHGRRVPQVGLICMDQCMIDVTEIPDVCIGDEAVLFGKQENEVISLAELADKTGTIVHEILCNINRRVPRVYIKDGQVVKRVEYLLNKH